MKRLIPSLAIGLAVLLLPGLAWAQQGTVTGTVTEAETGNPLPGATVQVVDQETGTATDAEGNYRLRVPAGEQTLRVTFVGYQSTERTVNVQEGGTTRANFRLQTTAAELDEVVVTGVSVGTETAKLGFEVSKIGEDELQAVPSTDPASALRGKTPGARIVQASGQPGTAPSVRLRGTTTLSGSQEPLVVVDGAITSGGLEDIDMQSVESIEIIKGAAAASLYGSLAGNGVIQVITKRGSDEVGTTRVTVRNEVGFTQIANTIDLAEHHNRANSDGEGVFRQPCDRPPCPLNSQADDNVFDNDFSEVNDQQEAIYEPRAFFTNYASVSSRQENLNYLLSFENSQNDGIVEGFDPYKRRNMRLNVDNQVTDDIEVSASVLYSNSDGADAIENGQQANNPFYGALLAWPDLQLDAPAPDSIDAPVNPFSTAGNAANPLYRTSVVDRSFDDSRLFGNIQANAELTDWLTVDGQFSWDDDRGEFQIIEPAGTFPSSPTGTRSPGDIFRSNNRERVMVAQGRAILEREFGDLRTQFTGRYTYEDRLIDNFNLSGSNYLARGVNQFPNTDQNNLDPGEFDATIRSEDIVGNLVLDYQDTYILDGVVRRERVSLFGPDARDKIYWRIAGTYRADQNFEIPGVQQLKLRGTVGTSGSRPPFQAQYETFTVTQTGITKDQLGNSEIQPANTREFEVGLNAFFLDRFNFEATYSEATAEDQVLEVPLSGAAGFSSQFQNAGTVETSTFELSAGGTVIDQEDFGLDFSLVFDRTRQTVTELDRPGFTDNVGSQIDLFRIEEGVDIGVMFGNQLASSIDDLRFDSDGCLVGETGAQSSCLTQDDLTVNDDGYVVEDGTQFTKDEEPFYIRDESGRKVTTKIGDSNPDFNAGISTTLRYNNFRLFSTLDWEQGADVYNYTKQLLYFNDRHGDLDQADKPEGQRRPGSYYSGPLYNQASASSHFVEDGSFIKLREVSLTYQFTPEFINSLGLGSALYDAKISVLGRNLFTWSDYTGYDPEVSTEDADQPVNYKVDDFAYPNFRTFSASIELRF